MNGVFRDQTQDQAGGLFQAPVSETLGTLGHWVWTQALTPHVGSS